MGKFYQKAIEESKYNQEDFIKDKVLFEHKK